jgi:hypothetical protein
MFRGRFSSCLTEARCSCAAGTGGFGGEGAACPFVFFGAGSAPVAVDLALRALRPVPLGSGPAGRLVEPGANPGSLMDSVRRIQSRIVSRLYRTICPCRTHGISPALLKVKRCLCEIASILAASDACNSMGSRSASFGGGSDALTGRGGSTSRRTSRTTSFSRSRTADSRALVIEIVTFALGLSVGQSNRLHKPPKTTSRPKVRC